MTNKTSTPEQKDCPRRLEDARIDMEGCDDSEWANYLEGLVKQWEALVLGECEDCGHTLVTPLRRLPDAGAECSQCGFRYWAHEGHIIPCPVCALSEREPNLPSSDDVGVYTTLSGERWAIAGAIVRDLAKRNAAPQRVAGQTTALADEPGNPEPGAAAAAFSPDKREKCCGEWDSLAGRCTDCPHDKERKVYYANPEQIPQRGDAVTLARNVLDYYGVEGRGMQLTAKGIRSLAEAVLLLDAWILEVTVNNPYATPVRTRRKNFMRRSARSRTCIEDMLAR